MQTATQVTFQDMPVSDAVEARCWHEAEKLERYFDRIIGCHVTIAESQRRRRQGNLFDVRIHLTVPGRELVVSREPTVPGVDDDMDLAIRDAFDRMRRQLQDHVQKIRGQVKKHESDEGRPFGTKIPDEPHTVDPESRAAG